MLINRRNFMKIISYFIEAGMLQLHLKRSALSSETIPKSDSQPKGIGDASPKRLGVDEDGISRVYLVRNGSPEQNVRKAVELMGGIERFIGPRDIVVLKPNAQWWNQGMTNTDAMKDFIDMVLSIPGFSGEVIIAENHQYQPANSRGWTTNYRNGKFNLNELVEFFQSSGHKNVTKYHWQVAGTAKVPLQGDAQGNGRVNGPEDGDGYVWMEDCYYFTPTGRKCLMSYPVFTSSNSRITIDLRNGAWQHGQYLDDRSVRFINFSALNHHSRYCGVTASVKNLMGVVDMTCGFHGDEPKGNYNVHHIGVSNKIAWTKQRFLWRLGKWHQFIDYCYRNFHYAGGALGYFMRHVRMPDLNIITAERVGWGHRTDIEKSFQPRIVLASRDPVALDYIAVRDVLYPGTPSNILRPERDVTYKELNNPDKEKGPFRKFLIQTGKQGIGNLDKEKIHLISYEFKDKSAVSEG